jgi:hypothetical protein
MARKGRLPRLLLIKREGASLDFRTYAAGLVAGCRLTEQREAGLNVDDNTAGSSLDKARAILADFARKLPGLG